MRENECVLVNKGVWDYLVELSRSILDKEDEYKDQSFFISENKGNFDLVTVDTYEDHIKLCDEIRYDYASLGRMFVHYFQEGEF